MAKKRAFVRYTKEGKIVPGSLILTNGSYPNGPAVWYEVPADLCCVTTSNKDGDGGVTPTTTVAPPAPTTTTTRP
jgi:hypothetical protein